MGMSILMRALAAVLAVAKATAAIYTELPSTLKEVDVIIAGGGTAGTIIASRLAEADASLSILVIEQGGNNFNVTDVIYPALALRHILPGSDTASFWKAKPSPLLAGREHVVETGNILGGGSSINWMVYTRAQWDDFESWNTSGWTAEDVLPYLKKTETYHGATTNQTTHGYDGPVHVSKGSYEAKRAQDSFIEGASDAGYDRILDLQSLHSSNGTGPWYRFVSPEDGRRQDVGHRYLHPLLQSGKYPNLHVLVETQVVRILFDGEKSKRAVGVELRPNPKFTTTGQYNGTIRVAARKLVVASAGAFGTPLLLERSGVGEPSVLDKARVPLVEALPGVGGNFQDHQVVRYIYRTSLTLNETLNGIADNTRGRDVPAMIARDDPQLGWNGIDASSKLRPSPADVAALGPEFEALWARDYKDAPNRPLMITSFFLSSSGADEEHPDDGEYVSVGPWTAYPYARGHVHITGPDMDDDYDFDPGFLLDDNDFDLKSHIWGYKTQRRIARRMTIFRGEPAFSHPKFSNGSEAAVVEVADGPISNEIRYTAEDDAAIAEYIRETVASTKHPLGTCKMAAREDGGVVDAHLNVYGVTGLKVADLSIAPLQVAANTYSTVLMLGERAAAMFIDELGLA